MEFMKVRLGLIIVFFTLLYGCGSTNDKKNNVVEKESTIEKKKNVYLIGVYATSTANNSSVENLFDGKLQTNWATKIGAGPYEGIMFHFAEPTHISSFYPKIAVGSNLVEPSSFTVYIDGENVGNYPPNKEIVISKIVNSFFLRINAENSSKQIDNQVSNDVAQHSIMMFDKNKHIGLSVLIFRGKDDELLNIKPPKYVSGSVVSRTVLEPQTAYGTDKLFDSRYDFAWAEGAEGNGVGEDLVFEIDEKIRIDKIVFWNGYQRSDEHFTSNTRLYKFEFSAQNTQPQEYSISDSQNPVEVILKEPIEATNFLLKIKEVYAGTQYKDLVISEICFYSDGVPYKIKPNKTDDLYQLNNAIKNTPLSKILDRCVKNTTSDESIIQQKSIIIHSDYTFVVYDLVRDKANGGDRVEKIIDGNWELISAKKGVAKIRVFGKLRNNTKTTKSNTDEVSDNLAIIFHDFIEIRNNTLRGKKFIPKFYIEPTSETLLNVLSLDSSLVLDMRYATDSNFLKKTVYPCGNCLLRYIVAKDLLAANSDLRKTGFQLKLFDCYRPISVQKLMWEIFPNPNYVANPYKNGSIHSRACAVDVTIIDSLGKELDMGTTFDFFGVEAHYDYKNLSDTVLTNRKMLRKLMAKHNFNGIRTEWWHFSHHKAMLFRQEDVSLDCN